MSHIVILSGSPSAFSRSDKVLKYLGELLEKERFSIQYISV
ncbi:FMN reductase (NADPH), partial [Butyricicoccus sp. 1XD8-22]